MTCRQAIMRDPYQQGCIEELEKKIDMLQRLLEQELITSAELRRELNAQDKSFVESLMWEMGDVD